MSDSLPQDGGLKPGERPTLKTISRITGLAVATVSRALHDAPDISSDTKKRVRECADRIGYHPDRAGVRLRTGKTNVISLVVSTENDIMAHVAQLISSIAGGLRDTRYHLVMTPFFPDEDPMKPIRYVYESRSADAIIMNQTEAEDPRVKYLKEMNFPFVTHGQTMWNDHPYCDFDNKTFAELGIDAFARRGRKCVLVVAPPHYQFYGRALLDGTRERCEQLGIKRLVLQDVTSDSPITDVEKSVAGALKSHPEIDAIICGSTNATIAAVDIAERLGRVLAQDFDVYSKEASPLLERFRKGILVVHEDVAVTGAKLAEAAIQAIEKPELPPIQNLSIPVYNDPLLK